MQACQPPMTKERRSIGVQGDLPPTEKEKRFVGVQGDLPPMMTKDRGVQTPREEGVGGGGGTWSSDRVAALIDAKMEALRNEIVTEVCAGAGGRAPARMEGVPPSPRALGPVPPSQDKVP